MSNPIVQLNEEAVKSEIKELVRSSVEESQGCRRAAQGDETQRSGKEGGGRH